MVDKLTKYSHFIPFKETYTAEQLGYVIIDRLIRYHGIPEAITSDRDKLFTSNYWKTLVGAIGIKQRMSTAYHPQTDGQTERTNQTLEVYLRHYVNNTQNNWVSLLPIAQLALNNHQSATTGQTPFFANYGRNPNLFHEPRKHPNAEKAMITTTSMKQLHEQLRNKISKQNTVTAKYQNQKRKMEPLLKKGDKVYLLTKNLKTKKPSKKLDQVKVGPFSISEIRGPVNYKLDLPSDARIHPVFHISLLEPADPDTPLQDTFHFQTEENDEFEVERILRQQGQNYLVKWKGYPESENTWEPTTHLQNCQQKLREYHQRSKKGKRLPIT